MGLPVGTFQPADASVEDTSASANNAPPAAIADYLAPISKMRWGPFSVNGWDAFGSWSNQPLGLNGQGNGPAQLAAINGIQTPTTTFGYHISTSMGARWRWGRGFIGLQYAPSIDYQTATGVRQINWQNVSMFMDHPFQLGKWRLTMGVRSAAITSYNEVYNPPSLVPLLSFQAPITNTDLIGLLTEPQPLQPVLLSQLFLAQRFYTGSAAVALTRVLNGRDSVTLSVNAVMNHSLNFGQETGALFNYPQSSGGTAALDYAHTLSARSRLDFVVNDTQTFGAGGGSNGLTGSEQTVQVKYTWTPWKRLSFQAGGGPARQESYGGGAIFTYAGSATVSFTPYKGSTITSGYSRSLDPNGFSGGTQANQVNLSWSAPQPHGHKWRYGLTTNFFLGNSLNSQTAQPGQYATGAGVTVTASYSYPVTRAMMFTTNYAYLFQDVTNVQINNSAFPARFQRHLVSVGFHYSFGLQGAAAPLSIGTGH
jgi:hypothetical protein